MEVWDKLKQPPDWALKKITGGRLNGGERFGLLTVGNFHHKSCGHGYYLCVCDCGKQTISRDDHLLRGATVSCGCYKKSRSTTHGLYEKNTYKAWCQMFQRCSNPHNAHYKNYGQRGISVSEEWQNFSQFFDDMGERPNGTTLDRKDNNGDYCKENCRWATKVEQSNNKRTNRILTFNGVSMNVKQWSIEKGINYNTLTKRLRTGWTTEAALSKVVIK